MNSTSYILILFNHCARFYKKANQYVTFQHIQSCKTQFFLRNGINESNHPTYHSNRDNPFLMKYLQFFFPKDKTKNKIPRIGVNRESGETKK